MAPPFGAQLSVAGGLPRAVERAILHECDALQIFTKNASQWRGRALPPDEIAEFRARVRSAGIDPVVSHASYLINLASTSATLQAQSRAALDDELARANALGLLGVVLHPGCYTSGTPEEGLTLIANALLDLLDAGDARQPMILLEHTAGQGTALGARFEELASILEQTKGHPRIGVCLDTCHLVAAGYDLSSPAGYARTFDEFERLIGFERLRLFHVNDSKKPLGSRVDRHTHIGDGCVGLHAFRRLVNDPRFQRIPMLLETPKDETGPRSRVAPDRFDEQNLRVLRGLAARTVRRGAGAGTAC